MPRSVEWCREGVGQTLGAFKLLYYHCNTTKINRVEQPRTVCGAEECREMPRSAEECRGVWGAFKLLYYHCNTTKIDRVEQPRTVCGAECREGGGADTVCGAEECREMPRSAEECLKDIGVPLNYSTTIEIPLK